MDNNKKIENIKTHNLDIFHINRPSYESDYSTLKEITVTTQDEFNDIPDWYSGYIYIESRSKNPIKVYKRFNEPVIVLGCSEVIAANCSTIEARDNSFIYAYDNSYIEAKHRASVEAYNRSTIIAKDYTYIICYDFVVVESYSGSNTFIKACGYSIVKAGYGTNVVAYDYSSIISKTGAHVEAYGHSRVNARDNMHVKACESSYIITSGYSSVEAYGNSIIDYDGISKITAKGSSHVFGYNNRGIVSLLDNAVFESKPRGVKDVLAYYDIRHDKGNAIMYKAVHKIPNTNQRVNSKDSSYRYISDYNNEFEYVIGKDIEEECDRDKNNSCSYGIHVANMNWCLDYGKNWEDLAILEVSVKINSIIIPYDSKGKMRTPLVTVLREIPLYDCGILGRIILEDRQRRNKNG